MATLREPFALDRSLNTTEATPRNIADVLAEELGRLGSKTASDVMYDNTDSGLAAENVQDALDEINGKVVQSDWEQADPTADDYIKNKPTTDLQTAVSTFSTLTGGLLSEAKLTLEPVQDLHGYDKPWSGGSGKNKADISDLSLVASDSGNKLLISNLALKAGTYTMSFDVSKTITSTRNRPLYVISGVNTYAPSDYNTQGRGSWTFTLSADSTVTFYWWVADNSLAVDITNFMIESGSTATDYEPYENICPISGHTEAELDVSDDDSTTVSYVTPLGTTIYMANIDMVSGGADVLALGGNLPSSDWIAETGLTGVFTNYSLKSLTSYPNLICSEAVKGNNYADVTGNNGKIGLSTSRVIWHDERFADVTELMNYLSNHDVQLVYELATPQHIQLSPQLIQTLVGENNLSAPLEGQTIDEVKYRQVFTFEDVVNYINGQGA